MNIFFFLEMALTVWDRIAAGTARTADEKISAEIRAALRAIEATRGTEVTQVQLESLRTQIQWPDVPAARPIAGTPSGGS